jgi:hypothetical protein
MVQLPIGETDAERERQSYEDQLAIMAHARRLHMIAGLDFTIEVLAAAVRVVTSKPRSPDGRRTH